MTTAIKNFISLVLVIAFFLMLVSTNAYADTIVGGIDWSSQAILGDTYDGSNGFSAAWLNGLYDLSDRNIATNRLDGRTYNATSRAGVFWPQENDNPLPSTNIGQEEDGLLNGENDGGNDGTYSYEHNDDINNIYNTMEYQFDGLEFISEQQLQDVDGLDANIDGRFDDDPGWIRLYKEDVDENGNTEESSYGSVKDTDGNVILEINDGDDNKVLDFEITKNGNNWEWSLIPTMDIVDRVSPILGDNIFDHLALSIKGGNGFAVYDFDFNMIFDLERQEGNDFSFQPYILTGTFNTDDLLKGGGTPGPGLSHISVWARDPAEVPIPEPSTLILLGGGLVGLGFYARRRK